MSSKNILVTTTEKNCQEGINDTKAKPKLVDEAITYPIAKNKIDTTNKTYKPKSSISIRDKSISNESNKVILLDKSRSLDK